MHLGRVQRGREQERLQPLHATTLRETLVNLQYRVEVTRVE